MTDRTESGKKAPSHHGNESVGQAGKKEAEVRHSKSPKDESSTAKKDTETRKQPDQESFSKMGQQGSQASGKSRADED